MGKRIVLYDDLEGELVEADRTVRFAYEGRGYEIDLSEQNAEAFAEAMAKYVAAARPAPVSPVFPTSSSSTAQRPASLGSRSTASRERAAAIRSWAAANGYSIPAKGRIPGSVVSAYEAAQ